MTQNSTIDFEQIRNAMAGFELSPKVEPNAIIETNRAFFPNGHRGVLDTKRQLVVGNRGMGKSFWTHALTNIELKTRLAKIYLQPNLINANVVIGFNGSEKLNPVAPTIEEVTIASNKYDPEVIWRAVFLRAVESILEPPVHNTSFADSLHNLDSSPETYSRKMTDTDNLLTHEGKSLLIVFDALDRLAADWPTIRKLTKGLLLRTLGLQSFLSIRAKIFMRVDQFSDSDLFQFPDSSKIKNDSVNLAWQPNELFSLMLFELLRNSSSKDVLKQLASETNNTRALPTDGEFRPDALREQEELIRRIAGEFMGGHKKRGRVYTWVPLHLSDAANNCSPRTFLAAWKSAAEHIPAPTERAIDHLGLIDGVRKASINRLTELNEDYPWIKTALEPLRNHLVPITKEELFSIWEEQDVVARIMANSNSSNFLPPVGMYLEKNVKSLLQTMSSIAVMEERTNGKINVPDIFRVDAGILRKGGVAVPKRK